jgi:sugar lactone lactonase YvrE
MNADGHESAELALELRCALGESPVWDPRSNELVWVDIRSGNVYWWAPGSSRPRSVQVGHTVSAIAPRRAGGYMLATRSGFAVLDEAGSFAPLAEVEAEAPENRMNDGKVDPRGRFWAGTMSELDEPGAGSLYRLDLDGSVAKVIEDVTISNGLGWSPDASIMYYVDSLAHSLDAFDFALESGAATARRVVAEIPPALGLPDGLTVDEQGHVWVALHSGGAVHRYSPDGDLVTRVELPVSLVTSCAFAGPKYQDLYITTAVHPDRDEPLAGSIFHYRPRVGGIPGPFCES